MSYPREIRVEHFKQGADKRDVSNVWYITYELVNSAGEELAFYETLDPESNLTISEIPV